MADVKISDLSPSTTPDTDDIIEVEVDGVSKQVTILNIVDVGAAAVLEADYNANSVLAADTDNTPTVRTISEQQVVGRLTGGNIKGLSATELTGLINAASDTAAGKIEIATLAEHTTGTSETLSATPAGVKQETDLCVKKSLYDAYTVLTADTDNTPVATTIGASNFLGRKSSGGIVSLTAAEALAILGSTFTVNMKVVTATRTSTEASGDVNYTGAGFTPSRVIAFQSGTGGAWAYLSFGFADSVSSEACISLANNSGSGNNISTNLIQSYDYTNTRGQRGNLKAFISDGVTIEWTKVGSPETYTISILFIFIG